MLDDAFPNKPCFFTCQQYKTLLEKEKLLVTSNFSFSHSAFYPFGELSAIFIKFEIVACKTLSVLKNLKFVVWERVTMHSDQNYTFQAFAGYDVSASQYTRR